MPKQKWMPSEEMVQIGNKMVPAVERYTDGGNATGELRPATSYSQPIAGAKSHGGHCATCGVELEPASHESAMGVCAECVADPKINQGRWKV
jgi:hypothetical protein